MESLTGDFASALLIAKPYIRADELRPIMESTTLLLTPELRSRNRMTQLSHRHSCYIVELHPDFPSWYEVERVEGLLYALAWIIQSRHSLQLHPDATLEQICRYLGCCHENSASPDVRWNLLDQVQPWQQTPLIRRLVVADERKDCVICARPVSWGHKRDDAHDQCVVYGRLILMPAVRAAREAALLAKSTPTAEAFDSE